MGGRSEPLPIEAVLPELLTALRRSPNAVLVAPPGAGKTTMVAPALIDQDWCAGKVIMLSPRRIAARAAAERIADITNEKVGKTVGYATRFDSVSSVETRILVVTEAIFKNQILDDPELNGVSAVLFDEVHERNLDSDFGLALALDAQEAFRPDLRIVAMSATLDGARFAHLMKDATAIESEGKSHPLSIRYVGRKAERRIEEEIAATVRLAVTEEKGDILAFLPGVREIDRTAEILEALGSNLIVHKLHGNVDPALQRQAIKVDPEGRRKVILATNIAETSLTIDGVRIVIDSGMTRRSRFDKVAGVSRLVTERVSQASATQRAGRAARQGAGAAYRLWEEGATTGFIPFNPPEIVERDLSELLLDCAMWGVVDPLQLRWLDAPPLSAVKAGRVSLSRIGAITESGQITAHGRKLASLPLAPHLAHMLVVATRSGNADMAADVAMLLSEPSLGGRQSNIEDGLAHWRRRDDKRSISAWRSARRWVQLVSQNEEGLRSHKNLSIGALIALAYPDRLSKRRDGDGSRWISVGGRGFVLDAASPLARNDWLAVADVQGAAGGARILSAAPIEFSEIEQLFGDQILSLERVEYDPTNERIVAEQQTRLGEILLQRGQSIDPSPELIANALIEAVGRYGLEKLPWSKNAEHLRKRAVFAGESVLADESLLSAIEEWLRPVLGRSRRLQQIDPSLLSQAIQNMLGWDGMKRLEKTAPAEFSTPAGTTHFIDYQAEAGPTVEARVQAFFGLKEHPTIGNPPVSLILKLTSPAGRPIQTTKDLPGFWAGSWRDVAKEMKGRYPKHPWPEDPANAAATVRTKKADAGRNNG